MESCSQCKKYWWCLFWSDILLGTFFDYGEGRARNCPACPKFVKKKGSKNGKNCNR